MHSLRHFVDWQSAHTGGVTEHQYCALIIDGNLEHRARLRLAMRASLLFPTVHVANSVEEVDRHLSQGPIDIVFIATREDWEYINRFIHRFKQQPAGRDVTYVLLLKGGRSSVEVARTQVDGAHALLLEPYSVESLQTISQIAERVKKERSRGRLRAALRLLVREIAAQLDQVARLEKSGAAGLVSRGVLREMCSVLGELNTEMLALHFGSPPGCLPGPPCNPPLSPRRHVSGRKPGRAPLLLAARDHESQRGIGGIAS